MNSKEKKLSLHPMSLEQALKKAMDVPLEKRRGGKPTKKKEPKKP